ncbi:unnamed protein product [Acanthoscelides obtectus]|uniref:Uncharacterized protein n=1 Tax=Acanthoscelides obtectus TaxID=200917 RepID=A0A9P0JVP1_ACAOB|nr:unnamed protein product [Acanthoscelides obtectus]CAK1623808.1 hypothetical protein AOBTE_LOCUS2199 [Acanthoscelides obtectus]
MYSWNLVFHPYGTIMKIFTDQYYEAFVYFNQLVAYRRVDNITNLMRRIRFVRIQARDFICSLEHTHKSDWLTLYSGKRFFESMWIKDIKN